MAETFPLPAAWLSRTSWGFPLENKTFLCRFFPHPVFVWSCSSMSCWLLPSVNPHGYHWVFRQVRESCHVFTALLGCLALTLRLAHDVGAGGSPPCTCWLWGAVQGAVQGSEPAAGAAALWGAQVAGRALRAVWNRAQNSLEFGSLSQSLQSVLRALCWECGFFSLPTIALQTTPACECWGLEHRHCLPKHSRLCQCFPGMETPQQEELGVTLPPQEGLTLFEVENEYSV